MTITHTGFKGRALGSAFLMTIVGMVLACAVTEAATHIAVMVGSYNGCAGLAVGARAWYQHSQSQSYRQSQRMDGPI